MFLLKHRCVHVSGIQVKMGPCNRYVRQMYELYRRTRQRFTRRHNHNLLILLNFDTLNSKAL